MHKDSSLCQLFGIVSCVLHLLALAQPIVGRWMIKYLSDTVVAVEISVFCRTDCVAPCMYGSHWSTLKVVGLAEV